jgi:hypothetical protein
MKSLLIVSLLLLLSVPAYADTRKPLPPSRDLQSQPHIPEALPDLVISNFTQTGNAISEGQDYRVSTQLTVKNTSASKLFTATAGPCDVTYYVSTSHDHHIVNNVRIMVNNTGPIAFNRMPIPGLSPSTSASYNVVFLVPKSNMGKTISISAIVDETAEFSSKFGAVKESNEDNNRASLSVQLR